MAQCKLTPREFIASTFSPQIAAVCSVTAEATCQKNNLSFVELLQPFCKLNTEGHIKDPQGNSVTIRNFRLSIHDINASPPEPSIARKLLNDSVTLVSCEHTTTVQIGTASLVVPISVPWFEAWREMFLAVQAPSDHEFTKHFLACMLVISTAEDNPLEKIQSMGMQLYQGIPGKSPKWFNNNTLRYFVLIHDALQDDKDKAEMVFTEMKNTYGPNNCFLLQMNSRPPGQPEDNIHLPDPWSQFLPKFADLSGAAEQNSSPRTPADTAGLSSMPNEVTTESDKFSHAETPVDSQCYAASTPEDHLCLSSSKDGQMEMGQEAMPTKMHPLSPEQNAKAMYPEPRGNLRNQFTNDTPINENVWADSPSYPSTQHGTRLSTQDLERLRSLITEFSLKSLLPYVEKQIGLLNDVISNKKGVSRSLFSATKRWFGTNKPGVPSTAPVNTVIYSGESPELQLRRLGDLCFMFGHYSLAYQAYHGVKRDFAADQAWLYYAGALEMAALSAFMQGEMNRKTIEYMDDAILTYLNSCKMPQFATRATLLSVECLKGRGLYGEAAKQLIRMTSEDSDLRSALLLEQAAYSFIGPKMVRKYAFHAVLAGHRFSKAGQKRHSLRCYQQAYQVYCSRGWSLAEDHIHFTIGRQAASLKQLHEAAEAFEKLLSITSKQPAPQQAAFLREFLHTHNLLLEETGERDERAPPVLPLPIVDSNDVKVFYGHLAEPNELGVPASHVSFDDDGSDDVRWWKMEETLLTEVQGTSMIFRPTIALYSRTSNNMTKPYGVIDEPVHFNIEVYNPLHIPLMLSDVTLLWSFRNGDVSVTNERTTAGSLTGGPVETRAIERIVLQAAHRHNMIVSLVPKLVGELKVLGLTYRLSGPSQSSSERPAINPSPGIIGKTLFEVQGPRLKNVKEKPGVSMYGTDYRLDMKVVERAPFMQVFFSEISSEVLCGEIQEVRVTLRNIGNAPLTNVHITYTDPRLCSLGERDVNVSKADKASSNKSKSLVAKVPLPTAAEGGLLRVGETHAFSLWVQAPYEKGPHKLDLLFYYENGGTKSIPKYRLCRHSWHFTVTESIHLRASASKSASFNEDSPILNLTMRAKNTSHSHDQSINEITLTDVFLRSDSWSIIASSALPSKVNVQPREEYHLLLKLQGKSVGNSTLSNVTLSQKSCVDGLPVMSFIEGRNVSRVCANESSSLESQGQQQQQQQQDDADTELTAVLAGMKFNSTLILEWQARITRTGVADRRANGQHCLDMEFLSTTYEHPKEQSIEQSSYGERLMIFGPEKNISGSCSATANQQQFSELEFRKNLVSFTLSHGREVTHRFGQNRFCTVPVHVCIQNYLSFGVDVKINTIGSSSQSHLPSIKSQVYSAQASTYFRYARHTAIFSHVEALGRRKIKLHAILPAPGTYDLAARIQVSARVAPSNNIVSSSEYLQQKWKIESICIINDDTPQ